MNRDKADLRDFPDFSSSPSAKQLRAKSTFATCPKVVGDNTNKGEKFDIR
jgi:hypothetical protein